MIVRELRSDDINRLKEIHEKFYKEEFELPDFTSGFYGVFAIVDDDKIITIAGVRPIAESIAITNKDISVRKRREALYKALEVSSFICNRVGQNQLHIFVQKEEWKRQLIRKGFDYCRGEAIYLNV